MGSPEDFKDRAHLGPSGSGLRSRGRRTTGERGEEMEIKQRNGRKQTARVSDSGQSLYKTGNHS